MEPDSLNTLAKESESLKEEVLASLSGKPPEKLAYLFCDTSYFFTDETLAEWRRQERYDELVEYILFNYEEGGEFHFWKQVLLDLRLRKDEIRAHTMLDGLYPGRLEKFKGALNKLKKHPENHFCIAAFYKAKGDVMDLLYEHAFLLENKPEQDQNRALVDMVRKRILDIEQAST